MEQKAINVIANMLASSVAVDKKREINGFLKLEDGDFKDLETKNHLTGAFKSYNLFVDMLSNFDAQDGTVNQLIEVLLHLGLKRTANAIKDLGVSRLDELIIENKLGNVSGKGVWEAKRYKNREIEHSSSFVDQPVHNGASAVQNDVNSTTPGHQNEDSNYSFLAMNFELLKTEPIGAGFSKVFHVRFKADKREYALKQVALLCDEEVGEAELMCSLPPHENLVKYFYSWYETQANSKPFGNHNFGFGAEKRLFIQMELCSDGDFRKWLNQKQRNLKEGEKIFRQALSAVAFLHEQKPQPIIHRDIKPENIFLQAGNIAKLGDFGLSRELASSSELTSRPGTPYYKAPELIRGNRKYNEKIDVYSLGKVYYELYAMLNLAENRKEFEEFMDKVDRMEFGPDFAKNFARKSTVIKAMLEKSPERRCTAEKAIELLDESN